MTTVILALAGLPQEPELVKAASNAGLTVVRRCVDAVDLLGAATLDPSCPVVLSAALPRVSADVVTRLGGRVLIGLSADALSGDRLSRLGIDPVLGTSPTPEATMREVADVCRALERATASPAAATRATADAGPSPAASPAAASAIPGIPESAPQGAPGTRDLRGDARRTGAVIAVWGPMGAPGRTTVALGVAEALARDGARVCLVDADTYAPSVAMALGLLEETSGLTVACRAAEAGTLSPSGLASLTMALAGPPGDRWRVLGGIARADRWADVRSTGLDRLWPVARTAFDVVVVDTGFCLEADDAPGAWGRQRNAAARSALAEADHVLAVADDSALGAARLVAGWPEARVLAAQASTTVVRNRASGRGSQWRAVVGDRVDADGIIDVPDDPRTLRACWSTGRSLGEAGRRSPARRALSAVARTCRVTMVAY